MSAEDAGGLPSRAVSEQACSGCRQAHALCDRKQPCGRCVQLGKADTCHPSPARKRGRPPKARAPDPTGDQHNGPPTAWRPITIAQQSPRQPPPHLFTPVAALRVDERDTKPEGADSAMTKTLMCMLVDEVRDVKEENRQLRDRVAKLRSQRKRDNSEMRAMERRLLNMEQSMQAMAAAQRESAVQMTSLLTLFQQKPPPLPHHATSSPQPPTASLMTAMTTTTSATVMGPATPSPAALSSLPRGFDSPPRLATFAAQPPSRLHGRAGLLHAMPFLRDYDPSLLVVSDLSQPFLVLRAPYAETLADVTPPIIEFVSPGASAFLGYKSEELAGKSIHTLGCIEVQEKLNLLHGMLSSPPPPSGVSEALRFCPVLRPKDCEPARVECLHQYLWANSHAKWNIALILRVLEEGVYIPPLESMCELLSNPSTRTLIYSRLAPFLRQGSLDRARICSTITTASSSSSSSSTWSPEASAQEETIQALQQSSVDLDIELQDMMRALRSPVPSPAAGPPADDYERWLL